MQHSQCTGKWSYSTLPHHQSRKPVSSSLPFNLTPWKTCGCAPPILLHIFQHLGGGQTDDG